MAKIELLMHEFVTHDTRRFILSRPDELDWKPGQGVELSIDDETWRNQGHPFTPVSLGRDRVLEFIIKRYASEGMTEALHRMQPGARLTVGDAFGSIDYQGPGLFIAAGTGITPFLAILRQLSLQNELERQRLVFTNKTKRDLICGDELRYLLGDRAIFTFTRDRTGSASGQRIDAAFLSSLIDDFQQHFYICGPGAFVEDISKHLLTLGAHPDKLVYER